MNNVERSAYVTFFTSSYTPLPY